MGKIAGCISFGGNENYVQNSRLQVRQIQLQLIRWLRASIRLARACDCRSASVAASVHSSDHDISHGGASSRYVYAIRHIII